MRIVEGVLVKMKSVILWPIALVALVIAHSMTDPTEASAGNWYIYGMNVMELQTTANGPATTDTIVVYNGSSTAVSVTWQESINWLVQISPSPTLTVQPGQFATFTATASPAGLAVGTYYGTAILSGNGIVQQVPVSLQVGVPNTTVPVIGLSPTSLIFTGTVGGVNPAAKTISIGNTGGGTLSWTASRNAHWLTLSPTSGTGSGSVAVNVNTANLQAGSYTTTITVSANGATPKSVPVTVNVTAPGPSTGAATLMWGASPSSNISGYKVYQSTTPGQYSGPIAVLGNVTSYQATGLQTNATYYFVVTSFDASGRESIYSNEVYKVIY